MPFDPIQSSKIIVQNLGGLNEREQFANEDVGSFDILRGCIPINKNCLTRSNGSKLLLDIGEQVLSIHQTNDSRKNILIQTINSVYLISENELFGYTDPVTNLVPVASNEEEDMSQAIITHRVAAGTNGGNYTTLNVWQQAPLTSILSQLNPDGTAAAFVTGLAANQFTLAAGVYRVRGYSMMAAATAVTMGVARLYNVTAGAAAWSGAANENSESSYFNDASVSQKLEINGNLNLAVPTTFEIQGLMNRASAAVGFGAFSISTNFSNLAGNLYRYIEILKTV